MKFSRRQFLQAVAAAAAGASASALIGCGASGSSSSAATVSGKPGVTAEPTASPTPEPTPSPTPEPPYEADVLTGMPRAFDMEDSRIIGIMINNISGSSTQNARPQRGLSSAPLLIEIKVEGGITRFCAVFSNVEQIPEEIGPMRSGRDQFLQLIMPFQALYYHEGESVFCTRYIKDWEYYDLNIGGLSYFGTPTHRNYAHRNNRGRNVAYEHTLFTSGEEVQKAIDNAGIDMYRHYNSTFFRFADYRYDEYVDLAGGASATNITIRHSNSYRTYFAYDEASALYTMSQYSAASKSVSVTVDELNGQALTFTNLVVAFTDIKAYPGDSHDIQDVDFDYGGVGFLFTNGRVKRLFWRKGAPSNGFVLEDPDTAEPVFLNRGKTYLTVVDLDEYENFHYEGNEEAPVEDDLTGADEGANNTESEGEMSEGAAAGISTS